MPDKKALIVIDMQNDYLWEKRKSMFTYDTQKLVGNVNSAIDSYGENGYDIIYTKHILPKVMWGVGFSIKGTEGAELYDGLHVISDLIFEKSHSDTFTSKAFREHVESEGYSECVGATAKGAVEKGIKVMMPLECIGTRFPEDKVSKMRSQLKSIGVLYI